MADRVCAVVGVGPGIGAACARRFAAEGYAVALLARSTEFTGELARSLPSARAYACDVTDAEAVSRAFAALRGDLGDPEVLLYNAGSGVFTSFEDTTAGQLEAAWRINAMGAFLCSKEVVPAMKRAGQGAIVMTGATASRKGGARAAPFASAKGAQRLLAESMARSLGPLGIHVALVVVDGVVDLPRARQRLKDKPDSFFVRPDGVAGIALHLVRQDRSAWSFEVEARPFAETW
ncbi:MAG TPA: SDR family NAD(P)-dependent oxidoreductase [Myxococcales bacterium]|nr:SDR family NAD(P)-dependent oxidoreductase [Myxococcales bacterium]